MRICDKLVWTASKRDSYVSSKTSEVLREKREEAIWWKMVWFPLAIPKQAFIMWLVVKDRLFTGERSLKMGYKRVKCSAISVIAMWRLVIIFSLSVALAPESENSACFDAELSSLLLYRRIFSS